MASANDGTSSAPAKAMPSTNRAYSSGYRGSAARISIIASSRSTGDLDRADLAPSPRIGKHGLREETGKTGVLDNRRLQYGKVVEMAHDFRVILRRRAVARECQPGEGAEFVRSRLDRIDTGHRVNLDL